MRYRVLQKLRDQIGQVAQTVDRGLAELEARHAHERRADRAYEADVTDRPIDACGRQFCRAATCEPILTRSLPLADGRPFLCATPMVSVNVSQLLLLGLGTVREFDFSEPLPDLEGELHLRGPVTGHARLTRTSEGILVHSEHAASVSLECARCLEEADAEIEGVFDEEFLPSTDIRTGLPLEVPAVPTSSR